MRRIETWFMTSLHVAGLLAVTYASLSTQTKPPSDGIGFVQLDSLLHVCAYGFLSLTAYGCIGRGLAVVLYALLLVLYGGGLELAQSVIPGRTASSGDFVANMIGVSLGLTLTWSLRSGQRGYSTRQ